MIFFLFQVILFFIAFIIAVAIFGFVANIFLASRGYKGAVSDHFDGTHFYSIGMSEEDIQKGEHKKTTRPGILKWALMRDKNKWVKRFVPTGVPAARVEGSKIVATFINHSTVLLQTEGLNIITDPIWAERASPFSFIGPKRYQNPGVLFSDLPHIDIILLSHNHYDHMDIATLKHIQSKFSPQIFVPLGVADYLARKGVTGAVELDWWDEKTFVIPSVASSTISIASVPSQHFAARAISDRNKSLWMGYVIRTPHGDIYFAGDTGYGAFTEKIAQKYPAGFRFGLIPIGAFKPTWAMSEVHISPEQAFKIKEELSVRMALGIHFGTFRLADDMQDEPTDILRNLRQKKEDDSFIALENGQSIEVA